MDLDKFKKEQEAVEARLRRPEPMPRYKKTKGKFETLFVQTFGSMGALSKAMHKSGGENVTCYYLDDFHVASWSSGDGWFIHMPKLEVKS